MSGGFNPTGSVTFQLFAQADATCIAPPVFVSTNPLSGSPLGATSGSFSTAAVGTYHWVATYSGDGNNTTVSSGCQAEPVTITQATPTSRPPPRRAGRSVSRSRTWPR